MRFEKGANYTIYTQVHPTPPISTKSFFIASYTTVTQIPLAKWPLCRTFSLSEGSHEEFTHGVVRNRSLPRCSRARPACSVCEREARHSNSDFGLGARGIRRMVVV